MACEICTHAQREKIEKAIFERPKMANPPTFAEMAKKFRVSIIELQKHAFLHMPMFSQENESIVSQIKILEGDLIAMAAKDYYETLTKAGKVVRESLDLLNTEDAKPIPKTVVDLYLGCGSNVKDLLGELMSYKSSMGEEKDSLAASLKGLVNAIKGSSSDGDKLE